jgi:outer membrane biogenesis lipoprotein LolB
MKNLTKTLFAFTAILFIASCSKNPEKLLVKKDGTWSAVSTKTIVGFGTDTENVEFTFKDGTGTVKDSGGDITSFTWSYDKKEKRITLTEVIGTDTYVFVYDVSEVKKDSEKWTSYSFTTNGVTVPGVSQTVALTRK